MGPVCTRRSPAERLVSSLSCTVLVSCGQFKECRGRGCTNTTAHPASLVPFFCSLHEAVLTTRFWGCQHPVECWKKIISVFCSHDDVMEAGIKSAFCSSPQCPRFLVERNPLFSCPPPNRTVGIFPALRHHAFHRLNLVIAHC